LRSGPENRKEKVVAAFDEHLRGWATWVLVDQTDLLTAVLQRDKDLHQRVSRALERAGRPAHTVSDCVREIHKEPALVKSAVTTYATFFVDSRDEDFIRNVLLVLKHDFGFRNRIALLIEFSSPEGCELAELFIQTLDSLRSNQKRKLLSGLVGAVPGLEGIELLAEQLDERRPELLTRLAAAFTKDPAAAAKWWDDQNWPVPFPLVLRKELALIAERRNRGEPETSPTPDQQPFDAYEWANHQQLSGLALSGGGIRSATFNLGVLQALASLKLLDKFDYLSTVSGGGYIASWMAGWVKRGSPDEQDRQRSFESFGDFENLLSPERSTDPQATPVRPLRYLRQFSNYLTPRVGLFSFDTWTMAAVYLRNVLLNQVTLIAGFGSLLLLPRLLGLPLAGLGHTDRFSSLWLLVLALVLLVCAMIGIGINLAAEPCPPNRKGEADSIWAPNSPLVIQWALILPFLLSCALASEWFWVNIRVSAFRTFAIEAAFWIGSIAFFAILSLILSTAGGVINCFKYSRSLPYSGAAAGLLIAGVAGVCGLVGALLLRGYLALLAALAATANDGGSWHAIVFGGPLLMTVLVLVATLHVGLLGVDLPDAAREWLSRFRAISSLYLFYWLVLFGAAIYGPLLIFWLGGKSELWIEGAGLGWIATTVMSLIAGKSGKTGTTKEGAPTLNTFDLIARAGPPVFAVGFILLISTAEHLLLSHGLLIGRYSFGSLMEQHWDLLISTPLTYGADWWIAGILSLLGTLTVTTLILAWRVDINEFSMHQFYKNRLVRCYLGASHSARKPNPFTGFDRNDDVLLSDLTPHRSQEQPDRYLGPYPIINATLNVSAGEQLALQERKAASFIFTPCFSGYDLTLLKKQAPALKPDRRPKFKPAAYRNTRHYGFKNGIHLGTAMAISGAAADPNWGFNTSTPVAFLMTVFDVRLGWWLGNPRWDKAGKLSSPRFGLGALISELLGLTTDKNAFVSLSDGGHFDNLGLYELVRRRCKFIIVGDAEQDGSYSFGSLGSAIRRCRIDFGAEIDLDLMRVRPSAGDAQLSEAHCAIGSITYKDKTTGTILYIKSSLTGDEPQDIVTYAKDHPAFPHESTLDQWFSESQFESYRKLGYHAGRASLKPGTSTDGKSNLQQLDPVFKELSRRWYEENPNLHTNGGNHTRAYNQLLETIRRHPGLHALGAELFPEAGIKPAPGTDSTSEIDRFFFCMRVLQFAEDIYFDLHLENSTYKNDPNIEGWLTLFRYWKRAEAVRNTWKSECGTFKYDFRIFWNNLEDERENQS
jgi:hypothetical protein